MKSNNFSPALFDDLSFHAWCRAFRSPTTNSAWHLYLLRLLFAFEIHLRVSSNVLGLFGGQYTAHAITLLLPILSIANIASTSGASRIGNLSTVRLEWCKSATPPLRLGLVAFGLSKQ